MVVLEIPEQNQSASSPTANLKSHSAKSPLLKKNINKVFQGKVDEDKLKHSKSVVNADSLGQLLEDLNMADGSIVIDNQVGHPSDDEETEDYTLQTEVDEMSAMGLPVSFGRRGKGKKSSL